jgi:hypothetical protein
MVEPLAPQEPLGVLVPLGERVGPFLECGERHLEDLLALGGHARGLLRPLPSAEVGVALLERVKEGHPLEKVRRLKVTEERLLAQPRVAPALARAAEPVLAEVEAVGRPRGGDQLEHGERHAARVHLLEDEAHRLLRGLLLEADHRERVVSEGLDHLPAELHEPARASRARARRAPVPSRPSS